jgi:putative component of membrane protein insertase Oxa1/YidC/SpoIIIJ protein YidD
MVGVCRFEPGCSSYALEAFETRAFPVAVAMTISRLLRCNPLTRRVTSDPVRKQGRHLRPGTARSWSILMMLVGIGLLFAAGGTASADPPTGGCTGSANGRPAAGITRDNPLKVKEHDTVSAKGTVPAGKSGPNNTHVEVFLIDPIGGITTKDHPGDGDTWSSSAVEVDDYLKYGVGTYKVEITNSGSGWECTFVGYVELDGNPLTKPVGIAALGFTALGAAGGLLAPRRAVTPAWEADQVQPMYAKSQSSPMDTILREGDKVIAAADAPKPPPKPPISDTEFHLRRISRGAFACIGCLVGALLLPARAMPIVGMGGGSGVATKQDLAKGEAVGRVWRRGRPILGFFSGLFFGLGVSVLLWQYNVWLLTTVTAIVIPVVLGILFGIYAWIGRPYEIVAVRNAAAPPPTTDTASRDDDARVEAASRDDDARVEAEEPAAPEVVADADPDPTEGGSSPTA